MDFLRIIKEIDDEKEIIDYFSDVEKLRYLYYNGNHNEMRNHINDITKKYPKETSVWYSVNTKKPCTVKEEFTNAEKFLYAIGVKLIMEKMNLK